MAENTLAITDLRGGMNDIDPPHIVPDDQCVLAMNVEFYLSTLGERRRGSKPIDTLSGFDPTSTDVIVFLGRHQPTTDESLAELWAAAATVGTSVTLARRPYQGSTWTTITPGDAITVTSPTVYGLIALTLHGKFFLAYASATDRLHVWDGSTLRRTGLAEPAAPTVADSGAAGTYATVRYFRVRYVEQGLDGTILLRSEPSEVTTFTPSGVNSGAVITRPALLGESETHWEVEASSDNANFYEIARVVIATTTYTDTVDLTTQSYADVGTLSESVGEYTVLPSCKYLQADDDRLIMGGSYNDPTHHARVSWTPVLGADGVGNDERVRMNVDSFIDLDTYEGGDLTGLSKPANGSFFAFKVSAIYQFRRTGNADSAYSQITITKEAGAIDGSVVPGMDENGRACTYFIDPKMGPCRIGAQGLQEMRDILNTWTRVNTSATIVARGVYYPDKRQVHWWVSVDGSDTPTLKIVSQVNQVRGAAGYTRRGFSLADGHLAAAYAVCLMSELVTFVTDDGYTVTKRVYRPYVGQGYPDFIQRMDVGDDDNGTGYIATLRTKPYLPTGLLQQWESMVSAFMAVANAKAKLVMKLIRDYGVDSQQTTTDLVASSGESIVTKQLDDLAIAEANSIQLEISDAPVV